jgi:hypothetical protein
VGKQLGAVSSVSLSQWVVPAATEIFMPTKLSTSGSMVSKTLSDLEKGNNASRYQWTSSWLFLIATSVIAFHFLCLTGTGTAVVLHRELQLSPSTQKSLAQQTVLFWFIGLGWMVGWFTIFYLLG